MSDLLRKQLFCILLLDIARQNIDFTYGADNMRVKTIQNDNGTILTKYFALGDYEEETDGAVTTKYYYIMAGDGLAAIYKQISTAAGTMYYVHKDLLGSIDLLTTKVNNTAQVAERYAYDAWGNRRNPANWTQPDLRTAWIIVRGYIGQEHLDIFGLINLNGRMYEPRTGRFLSADDYVQSPDYSQSYNRYAYCVNNPLRFSDPNGEFWNLVIGAVVGGVLNWAIHGAEFTWKGLGYFGIGAVSGALGAGIGGGISSMIMGASFGAGFVGSSIATLAPSCFLTGAATGGTAGVVGSFVNGVGNGLMAGQSFGDALVSGIESGIVGGVTGALLGGIYGGINAACDNRNFWTGKKPYYEVTLNKYTITPQKDQMNCKNAILESMEKMNGGTRTQDDFKRMGDAFLQENPKATLEEYFEYFGFRIENPQDWSYNQIGRGMELGSPTVINENIEGGHTLTIIKIRQWNPNGNVKVWFGDPARGIWKANWNIIGDPSFNKGAYLFWLHQ